MSGWGRGAFHLGRPNDAHVIHLPGEALKAAVT